MKKYLTIWTSWVGLFHDEKQFFGDYSKDALWQHKHWQFQRQGVDVSFVEKYKRKIEGLDDLYGALGTFSLYASGCGSVSPVKNWAIRGYFVSVTELVIYVRDTYDFCGEQYLGHWNSDGVKIADQEVIKYIFSTPAKFIKNDDVQGTVFVSNSSFREYRKDKKMGGDLLIFSDTKVITLNPPWLFYVRNKEIKCIANP